MSDILIAVALAAVFSILIGIIELQYISKSGFRPCLTGNSATYFTILLLGNIATTLTAGATSKNIVEPASAFESSIKQDSPSTAKTKDINETKHWPPEQIEFAWFWFAFIGVFGFEALLQKINLTFDGKGVLTINDWIVKARNNAVASAIKAQADAEHERAQLLAQRLRTIPEDELNAHILTLLGKSPLELDNAARAAAANPILYKALALAYGVPERAAAIVT